LWTGFERAEIEADAALRRRNRPQVRQKADQEQRPAQTEADQKEALAGTRNACRPQGRQGDVDQDSDQGVAVGVANTPRDEESAEVLRSLRRQGRDERCAGYAADGRHPELVERTPP
jgi:hypothetical protein